MIFDVEVSTEVSDRIAEIGRSVIVPKPANYDSPEGVLFRGALALIEDENDWFQGLANGGMCKGERGNCTLTALTTFGSNRNEIVERALSNAFGDSLIRFNATHTHAEVIAKWHEAGRANGWLT